MDLLPFEKIERRILVHSKENIGQAPERSIEELLQQGILVIDKTKGPTSHQVADWTKRALHIKKAGQAGTLDPGVTGLLPVAVNKATNILQVLLKTGKEYVCYMHLHEERTREQIEAVIKKHFSGTIKQIPPIISAVKRRERSRKIYYLSILEVEGKEVLFKVGCQAGTYIRKLCHDIGEQLGCGAHMAQLIRTKSGGFTWQERTTLFQVADAYDAYLQGDEQELRKILHPIEEMTRHLAKVWIKADAVQKLKNGLQVRAENIIQVQSDIEENDYVAVMSPKNELVLIAFARCSSKKMLTEQGNVLKTFRVVI